MDVFMNKVSFYGESAGSISYSKNISARGGESAGSIAKVANTQGEATLVQAPECDTVNFKGREEKKKSSVLGTILGLAATAGVAIGGLAYAHKTGSIAKLKDGNIKKHLTKAGETCYEWCNKTKDFGEKYYNKIKDYINKNS